MIRKALLIAAVVVMPATTVSAITLGAGVAGAKGGPAGPITCTTSGSVLFREAGTHLRRVAHQEGDREKLGQLHGYGHGLRHEGHQDHDRQCHDGLCRRHEPARGVQLDQGQQRS